ncbi:hypothetical protein B0H14DRAFT_3484652 [Mycena olivaceomarginata]|nr:hypothetical protein B0H14DRAFT_3484652 [Mycena olivaceomarginata]
MVVVTQHYHEGKEVAKPRYTVWELLGTEDLKDKKQSFFSAGLPTPQAGFLGLHMLMVSLFIMFRDGYNARSNAKMFGRTFLNDTLGDRATFDSFAAILFKEDLPL